MTHWRKYKACDELIYADKIARGCSRCSERRPHCLHYHHVNPSAKQDSVSRLRTRGRLSLLPVEMAKCILLCANCHAVQEYGDGYKDSDRPKGNQCQPNA